MGETTPRTQAESRIATARAHPRPRKRNSRGTPDELVVISMVCTISCLSTPNSYKKNTRFPGKTQFSENFTQFSIRSPQFGPIRPKNPQFPRARVRRETPASPSTSLSMKTHVCIALPTREA